MGPVKATAHLFFGNRPLPVGRNFSTGEHTKVLWTFSERVSGFSGVATNLDEPQFTEIPFLETSPANTGTGEWSFEWPSYVIVPAAGCWRFDLKATTSSGEHVTGSFTYVAVP